MGWPSVNGVSDGEYVESEVLNRPVRQLAERTDYLMGLLKASNGTVYVDGSLNYDGARRGDVVYRIPDGDSAGSYGLAVAAVNQGDVFYADPSAMAVGMVAELYAGGRMARIVLAGSVEVDRSLESMFEGDGRSAEPGRCYLSASSPGRLTKTPNGPVIYVCTCVRLSESSVSALVNPQYRDTGESHVHRSFVVPGLPRGAVEVSGGRIVGIGDHGDVRGSDGYDENGWYLDSVRGWLAIDLSMSNPSAMNFLRPLPYDSIELTVDGVEARSEPLFGAAAQWSLSDDGGTLYWHSTDISSVLPFGLSGSGSPVGHDIVLYTARACVGPTGFVTSLDVVKGSPLKIVGRSSFEPAHQGDLQIGLDVDFTTKDDGVRGFNVVKSVDGSTFRTGPVVERVQCGPGLDVMSDSGVADATGAAGIVRIGLAGSFHGDFETIALENAKQALVGGFFPYTRLLGWDQGGRNVNTAFTAKFRVPDYIPDAPDGYNVSVAMSVFGEMDSGMASVAGISLSSGVLPDYSTVDPASFRGGLVVGESTVVDLSIPAGYSAYDPLHKSGNSQVEDAQHERIGQLLLKRADSSLASVHPGWFVGVRIARCAPSNRGAAPYTAPLGFVSLRWSLVRA